MLLFQYIHTFYIKISILLNIWYSLTFVVYIPVQFKEHSFHMKDQGMAINANTCAHTHTHTRILDSQTVQLHSVNEKTEPLCTTFTSLRVRLARIVSRACIVTKRYI